MSLLSEKYEKIIGVGFSFPFHFSGNGGVAKQGNNGFDSSIEKIRESLFQILGTILKERFIRRDFGNELHNLLFEGIDPFLLSRMRQFVIVGILKYEKRINVVNIDIINRNENSGLVEINVDFVVRQTNQSGNIVYPFYLNRNQ